MRVHKLGLVLVLFFAGCISFPDGPFLCESDRDCDESNNMACHPETKVCVTNSQFNEQNGENDNGSEDNGSDTNGNGSTGATPKVHNVTPTSATLDELTTFTVTGDNLPVTLAAHIDQCENLTWIYRNEKEAQFRCTPSYSEGLKNGVIRDGPGGPQLHTFLVQVQEGNGEDEVIPPSVEFLTHPESVIGSSSATFEFRCHPEGCIIECKLNNEDWAQCESPLTIDGLGAGDYTFSIKAVLEQVESEILSVHFSVIPSTLTLQIVSAPAHVTPEDIASFEFSCSDPNCVIECALDYASTSGQWAEAEPLSECGSSVEYNNLERGFHRLRVQARDSQNSTVDESHEWQIDFLEMEYISAGGQHSCGLSQDGELWCWGDSSRGQLGDNFRADKIRPHKVETDFAWNQVSAGRNHTCGICENGLLWCWGANNYGQLGNGSSSTQENLPVVIQANEEPLLTWTQVAAGNTHTCALSEEGTLWCWGRNSNGQLGSGDTQASYYPKQVSGVNDWQQVSVGDAFSCAIQQDGSLWCWGRNTDGQIGNGFQAPQLSEPHRIGEGEIWVKVALGSTHACALHLDSSIFCWGNNHFGQLGTGTLDSESMPRRIVTRESSKWRDIEVGAVHSCAVGEDESLMCWGRNFMGQLGQDNTEQELEPQRVSLPGNWSHIGSGLHHSCAIKNNKTLWCWGANQHGQLGLGIHGGKSIRPRSFSEQDTWLEISAGKDHGCGIHEDQSLWCWGDNSNGQLGKSDLASTELPVAISSPDKWISVYSGAQHTCGISKSENTLCWGDGSFGKIGNGLESGSYLPVDIAITDSWAQLSLGENHTYGLTKDGRVYSWGSNFMGQLGNGTSWIGIPARVYDN